MPPSEIVLGHLGGVFIYHVCWAVLASIISLLVSQPTADMETTVVTQLAAIYFRYMCIANSDNFISY